MDKQTKIQAIETLYAGCRFRSRLEARWAVFFDQREWPWEYEPQGFQLPSGNYLPDFRVTIAKASTTTVFFEVKPPSVPDDPRWPELALAGQTTVIVAKGMHRTGDHCRPEEHSAQSYTPLKTGVAVVARDLRLWMNARQSDWDAASSARFEFGEQHRRPAGRRKRGAR